MNLVSMIPLGQSRVHPYYVKFKNPMQFWKSQPPPRQLIEPLTELHPAFSYLHPALYHINRCCSVDKYKAHKTLDFITGTH